MRWPGWVLLVLLNVGIALPALAETPRPLRGVALVIGQSNYEHLTLLANPANDARAMEQLLDNLGFEVVPVTDRDGKRLKRDLDRFVEDAEGADAAVVYYSGHGIEAGDESWLVPVDADVSSLDDAEVRLVPLSEVVERLKANVPVTIIFLDACRTNPFPKGAGLRKNGVVQPIAAAGLTPSKGAMATQAVSGPQGVGALIGFAAEPGHAALDGPSGGDSPYAAALLKHLSAMNGNELGTVMRMVTEEVYLKTGGRQRPWVNETLTKLLYFGATPEDLSSDEGQILAERRQLLLTIAGLSQAERQQVEVAATAAGVPMDAVYGLLKTLGAEAPKDPAALEKVLTSQTERLKTILAERATLQSEDAEILKLSALADEALAEGALDANVRFREAAKARFAQIASTLDTKEAEIKARRLEGGKVLADLAVAYELKLNYRAAAENFALAFDQIERWDSRMAWAYKTREADALEIIGEGGGDNDALRRSIETFKEALAVAPREKWPDRWAITETSLGVALMAVGERQSGTALLDEAVAAFRAALEETPRERLPHEWAVIQENLANVLGELGKREPGTGRLQEAIDASRAALSAWTLEREPVQWARAQGGLGLALAALGLREPSTLR